MKLLKKKYNKKARAGLINNKKLHKNFANLTIDKSFTSRSMFFNAARASKVCIVTTGLSGSTGWRFGEFVALGRAIVTEELIYQVPGNFKLGQNYLSFNSVDKCLEQIDILLKDENLRSQMQQRNSNYYYNYLSPDKMIENTLIKTGLLKTNL